MTVFEFSFKKIKLSLLIGYEGGVPEKKREKQILYPKSSKLPVALDNQFKSRTYDRDIHILLLLVCMSI